MATLTTPLGRGRGFNKTLGHKCLTISTVPSIADFIIYSMVLLLCWLSSYFSFIDNLYQTTGDCPTNVGFSKCAFHLISPKLLKTAPKHLFMTSVCTLNQNWTYRVFLCILSPLSSQIQVAMNLHESYDVMQFSSWNDEERTV